MAIYNTKCNNNNNNSNNNNYFINIKFNKQFKLISKINNKI